MCPYSECLYGMILFGRKPSPTVVFPQQVLRGHLDFDTANSDVMLPCSCLAPLLCTIVGSLLLLGRRQGLPSIFNTAPLVTSRVDLLVYSTHCFQNKPTLDQGQLPHLATSRCLSVLALLRICFFPSDFRPNIISVRVSHLFGSQHKTSHNAPLRHSFFCL